MSNHSVIYVGPFLECTPRFTPSVKAVNVCLCPDCKDCGIEQTRGSFCALCGTKLVVKEALKGRTVEPCIDDISSKIDETLIECHGSFDSGTHRWIVNTKVSIPRPFLLYSIHSSACYDITFSGSVIEDEKHWFLTKFPAELDLIMSFYPGDSIIQWGIISCLR